MRAGSGLSPAPEVTVLTVLETLNSLSGDAELGPETSPLGPAAGAAWGHSSGQALGTGRSSEGFGSPPPPVLGDKGIALELLEQGQNSLCSDAGQINLRF